MSSVFLTADLRRALRSEATVVTPTRRLASALLEAWGESQKAKVVPAPLLFALDDWVGALWNQWEVQGILPKQCLLPLQVRWLWEQRVRQRISPLVGGQVVRLALEAWEYCVRWQLPLPFPVSERTDDQLQFQQWAIAYQERMQSDQKIDPFQKLDYAREILATAFQKIESIVHRKVLIFYGFEEYTPQVLAFQKRLQEGGWEIGACEPCTFRAEATRLAFEDPLLERQAAFLWAKDQLKEGKKKIAIVVPDLLGIREAVAREAETVFDPVRLYSPYPLISPLYNISAAPSLCLYPIVQSALVCVQRGGAVLSEIPSLGSESLQKQHLVSPFIRGAEAAFLERWKRVWAWQEGEELLFPEQESVWGFVKTLPKTQTFYRWQLAFQKVLSLWGWPGERGLSSVEYQAVNRFYVCLQECTVLDAVSPPVTYARACQVLQQVVKETLFQPENRGAPIQILGLLEAAGQCFEALWVVGLHQEAWPLPARPNPFLPVALQRQYQLPHSGPERERQFAEQIMNRLRVSAPRTYWSYPRKEEGADLEVSPLIAEIREESFWLSPEESLVFPVSREAISDETGPSFTPSRRGNTEWLTLQAACPFRAFAKIRLRARVLEKRTPLAELPALQGRLLHEALAQLWPVGHTREALLAFSKEEWEESIDRTVKAVLQPRQVKQLPLFQWAEAVRLKQLITHFGEAEKKRPPWQVVASEWTTDWSLAGLPFRIRIDRIDKTKTGETLLIDYKMGPYLTSAWWGSRPSAPQMPFYFLAVLPDTLVVAHVQHPERKKSDYSGISRLPSELPGVETIESLSLREGPKKWEELFPYWEKHLSELVHAFLQGDARVSPLYGNATCRYCDLASFCRVQEKRERKEN